MQFAKLNRESSEKIFRTIKNVEGATITTGMAVALARGASTDGISATIANASADYTVFMGVAVEDIANNDYGLVQVNGYVNSVLCSYGGTSVTITAGDFLVPGPTGGFYSLGLAAFAGTGGRVVLAATTPTVSAAAYASAVISVL